MAAPDVVKLIKSTSTLDGAISRAFSATHQTFDVWLPAKPPGATIIVHVRHHASASETKAIRGDEP